MSQAKESWRHPQRLNLNEACCLQRDHLLQVRTCNYWKIFEVLEIEIEAENMFKSSRRWRRPSLCLGIKSAHQFACSSRSLLCNPRDCHRMQNGTEVFISIILTTTQVIFTIIEPYEVILYLNTLKPLSQCNYSPSHILHWAILPWGDGNQFLAGGWKIIRFCINSYTLYLWYLNLRGIEQLVKNF